MGVALGAASPFLLKRGAKSWRYAVLGNAANVLGAVCNVAATQFAPQSIVQPLAGLLIPATAALDTYVARRPAPRTRRFWGACLLVVAGDAAIVLLAPPMRKHADPSDASVLWMILLGGAVAAAFLVADAGPAAPKERHWALQGLRPGALSGFAITSTNAFFASLRAEHTHKHVWLFAIFALGLSLVQIVMLNQAAHEVSSEVDLQSVYVSSIVVSGTLVGLVTLENATAGTTLSLLLILGAVVLGASSVAKEHEKHRTECSALPQSQ